MNTKDIPIFILSYNRLDCLKKLIQFLEKGPYKNIHIIDNMSTYPPLLNYYKTLPYTIHKMDKNYGHMVLFEAPEFKKIIAKEYFVLTDSDVLPISECPDDFIDVFMDILNKNPKFTKVGFSLKIDDIPEHYQLKNNVLAWESRFYMKERSYSKCLIYKADIDTTFALYRPVKSLKNFYKSIRTGYPYQARHLPWYQDLNKPSEEDLFYIKTAKKSVNNWNGLLTSQELSKKHHQNEPKSENRKITFRLFFLIPLATIYISSNKTNVYLLKVISLFSKKITKKGKILIRFLGIPIVHLKRKKTGGTK